MPVASGMEAYVGTDYSYRSAYNSSANDSLYTEIDSYGIANARVGVRAPGGRWDVTLWARNLFDKDYFNSLSVAGFNSGAVNGLLGDPRTYGISVRARY